MAMYNNYIKVKELTDNLLIDNILLKYDNNSPYMFSVIVDADDSILQNIKSKFSNIAVRLEDLIVISKRVTKISGFNGYYIQQNDIIEIIHINEYNKYKVE